MKAERLALATIALALALCGVVCGKLGGKGGGGDNLPTAGIIPFSDLEADETFRFKGPAVTIDGATTIGGASVLLVGGRYRMWFSAARDGEMAVYTATSDDGLSFVADPTPILRPDSSRHGSSLSAPSVIWRGDRYEMYLEAGGGTSIVRASSSDGLVFTIEEQPLLTPSLDWEAGRVGSPSAVVDGERLLLYYEGGDGKGIGVAVAGADGVLAKQPTPILSPSGGDTLWDATYIGTPRVTRVVQITGRVIFRLYFAAGKEAKRSIGYAGSFDGLAFGSFSENPIFVPKDNVVEPHVIPYQGGFLMFFTRISGSRRGIFLAGHRLKGPYGPIEADVVDAE